MNIKYSPETNQILCGVTDITEDSVAAVVQWIISNNISMVVNNQTSNEVWVIISQQLSEADKVTLH
ncbi:hypothetical protein [uncultured Flavobacterium sp.]|uniref:hypothetical protein n=1 Tax=uncultured Flavobacterium sp. TaxID=165435 RepID=UPI0025993CC4|nr:hypothetical protein [uncultured Flavobacterium sp.]